MLITKSTMVISRHLFGGGGGGGGGAALKDFDCVGIYSCN